MAPTPIKVRGGKKKRQQQKNEDKDKDKDTPISLKRSLATILSERSTRRRANLDTLPAETLEKILLYSNNLSLPRASLLIGAKLSQRSTRLRLFVWIFHDTWDQWFGMPYQLDKPQRPIVNPEKRAICDGDPVLQSAILELPWVDIDFILQAQQMWANKYANGRPYQHAIHTPHGHGGFNHFDARQCFEADYKQICARDPFKDSIAGLFRGSSHTPGFFRDVHPLTRVPTKLITGPWTEEEQQRLFWLARGGALVNLGKEGHAPLPTWEVCLQGLMNGGTEAPEPFPNFLIWNCLFNNQILEAIPAEKLLTESQKLVRHQAGSKRRSSSAMGLMGQLERAFQRQTFRKVIRTDGEYAPFRPRPDWR